MFSKYQCGIHKGFSAQQCLVAMLEKWKQAVNKGKAFEAFATNLSKEFDCLGHKFPLAKLSSCWSTLPALKLVHNYLFIK